jgi:hypothetical protein
MAKRRRLLKEKESEFTSKKMITKEITREIKNFKS